VNHLRELLECVASGSAGYSPDSFSSGDARLLRGALPHMCQEAQCFWMGDLDELGEIAVIPEIARLPFRRMWAEGTYLSETLGRTTVGYLCSEHNEGYVQIVAFARAHSTLWTAIWFADRVNMRTGEFETAQNKHDPLAQFVRAGVRHVRRFCSALNCSNVTKVRNLPPPKVQRKRAKKGQAPLFSYWTLELTGGRSAGQPLGGTHASPRVHLRRGHARQYKPGQYTWVQPHAVGNKSLGMVHKDYAATPALLNRA
jgi:hypothetical protein